MAEEKRYKDATRPESIGRRHGGFVPSLQRRGVYPSVAGAWGRAYGGSRWGPQDNGTPAAVLEA